MPGLLKGCPLKDSCLTTTVKGCHLLSMPWPAGSTQKHWPWPSDYVLLGYAYILTHPGVPTVFYEHMYDWGHEHHDKIAQLVSYCLGNG